MKTQSEPTYWNFEGAPEEDGWFAVLRNWGEPEEGCTPDALLYINTKPVNTLNPAVVGFAGPFPDKETAETWAYAHDPEDV